MANDHGIIDWYEPVHETISYLPEVIEEIKDGANRLAYEASFQLMKHRDEGDAEIEVVHRKSVSRFGVGPDLDSYVMLTAHDEFDSERKKEKGWPAAMSIEMGAKNGGGGVGPLRAAADALSIGVSYFD